VHDGARVVVETAAGTVALRAVLDSAAREDVLHAPVGPDPVCAGEAGESAGAAVADLCARGAGSAWSARARIREA
jgi:hypothetical protein